MSGRLPPQDSSQHTAAQLLSSMLSNIGHAAPDAVVSPEATRMSELITNNRARLAAAPPDEAWRVALDIVEVEEWPQVAAAMVTSALPCSTCIAADMLVSMVQHLSELEQCTRARFNSSDALSQEVRTATLSKITEQLQRPGGLLATLHGVFTDVKKQQERQGDKQFSSSCGLRHGPDCPGPIVAAFFTPAPVAQGSGPPCRSCMQAHSELLVACSALLRFWPDCVLEHSQPVAWSWVVLAADCALGMLQDVSTTILQHQQLMLLLEQQRQPHAACTSDIPQLAAPPADVLQPGIAALQMLAAVCYAAAYPSVGALLRLHEQQQLCARGVLDHSCMLPSMLAVGAAAVLGQEMQRRLCRTTAVANTAQAGSAARSAGAAGAAGSSSETNGTADAAALQDGGRHLGEVPTCSSGMCSIGSGSDSGTQGTSQGSGPNILTAAWRLVCVTEQWAGGQLLPQPFVLLVEALGCSPKAFLLLACIWQQQLQAGSSSQAAGSAPHAVSDVLTELSEAYCNVFAREACFTPSESSSTPASPRLLQRMSNCDEKGQQQPQQAQQHLQLALLLMRAAVRGAHRGMFRFEPRPPAPASQLGRGSFADKCVSTWLCWAQFRRQQLGQAAAAGAANHPRDPWDVGGEASAAVLIELLQGHCLLLHEAARELQAVSSSWVTAGCSSDSTDSEDVATAPEGQVVFGGTMSRADLCVAEILHKVLGMLRCMAAAAAVDSRLMQQAAGHLFGLAGMLEQLVRVRTSFHCRQLVMEVDEYVPQLLRLLLGSINLSAYADNPEPWEVATGCQVPQQPPSAAAVALAGICACGLLPFLATRTNADGRQQRQLLGLLFSSLKMFHAYPTGLCGVSWSLKPEEVWLGACVDTIRAACMVGMRLLVSGAQHGEDEVYLAGTCGQAVGGSSSSTEQPPQQQQQHKQALKSASSCAGGCSSSAATASGGHNCGLGTEGTAALLPWLVLQGRALQLWVALFRAYVQLPPAARGRKVKAGSDQTTAPRPSSLVGSAAALKVLAGAFQETVLPSTQLLAAVLQGTVAQCRTAVDELAYGVGSGFSPDQIYLFGQVMNCGPQLRAYCQQQGLDVTLLGAASGSAATAAADVKSVLVATGNGLRELGDSAESQHKLRQSDVRRYLKTWQVADPAVLKGVLAMLSSGQHSAAGVAVAAWLCSRSIAGDLLDSLQDLSTQLSTLPIHEACNNPACRVTVGSREQGLVCGKACVCGGCRMGHYCSRSCQREHWPVHQLQCGAARAGVGKQ